MKRYYMFILLLLTCPIFFYSCTTEESLINYKIVMEYDDEIKKITASQEVNFVNNYDNAFSELYFHLYPNAFRKDAKESVVSASNFDKAYKNGFSEGKIDVLNVEVDGNQVEIKIDGEDENILSVELEKKVFPDERVLISIDYEVLVPNIEHRFGYGEDTINLNNFYPVLCVYESGKGFSQNLYCSNGDPFYSEIANYKVEITFDNNFTMASSGNVVKEESINHKKVVNINGEKIRDFAIVLSSKFGLLNEKVGDVTLNYYSYKDSSSNQTIELCKDVLSFFNEKFGEYPYKQLSVVQSDFCYGGMEYPNLVMISDDVTDKNLYYVIAHEIAHQWWYGVVGNDEYNEAWVDESLTEYSTLLFFENNPKYEIFYDKMVENSQKNFKFYYNVYQKVCGEVDTSMARALNEFDTEPEYIHSVYTQGVIMYDALRSIVGENKFYKACREYYKNMAYKNSSGAKLIAIFSNSCNTNLETFFESYLSGTAIVV